MLTARHLLTSAPLQQEKLPIPENEDKLPIIKTEASDFTKDNLIELLKQK